jgi:midasin (ATPase involved in ribosome maturation)
LDSKYQSTTTIARAFQGFHTYAWAPNNTNQIQNSILAQVAQQDIDTAMQATCLFQLVSERYEKGSIVLTSNKSYGHWGAIFADNVIASAILDRLLHHSTTINIKGESYRLKDKKKAGGVAAKLPRKDGA